MPQVGNPDQVAQGNRDSLNAGLDAIAQGILKRGENQRADAKQKWLEDTTQQKFDYQKQQDRITQNQNTLNYLLQRDQFRQNKAVQDFDMQRKKQQDEWNRKVLEMAAKGDIAGMFEQAYSNDPAEREYQQLLAELQQQQQQQQQQKMAGASLTLMGLNPQLMR